MARFQSLQPRDLTDINEGLYRPNQDVELLNLSRDRLVVDQQAACSRHYSRAGSRQPDGALLQL